MKCHFFNTHLKERLGLILFLLFMVIGALILHFYPQWQWKQAQESLILTLKDLDLEEHASPPITQDFSTQKQHAIQDIPFSYNSINPNTADIPTWMALGLSQKQAEVIINYRNKGGRFYSLNDLSKIYVLHQNHLDKMAPYLFFEPSKTTSPSSNYSSTAPTPFPKITINSASTEDLEKVKGIGPVLSKRIINFRDQLGGFHSPNQIKEVYHLPEETAQTLMEIISLHPDEVKKVNINQATSSELYAHPYLRPYQKQILKHIEVHGKVRDLEELKHILLINDEIFRKIAPYIAL